MATVASTAVAERFLQALDARDFDGITSCFASDARLRALVPTALRDDEGSAAVAERFRYWVGEMTEFAISDTGVEEFVDRIHIRYRMSGIDPEDGPVISEQQAYVTVGSDAITAMDLVCSGWRPAA
jgi:SnoaL-like domain